MKKNKLMLSRETIRQLTTNTLGHVVGGYAPEPSLACTGNCTGNCTAYCEPPPSDGCITQTCTTFSPECVVRF
jgi:hypothetical protein